MRRLAPRSRCDDVNFSVFSKHATRVDLLLFDDAEDARPARVLTLDPRRHRTYGRVPALSELGVDALLAAVAQDRDAGVRRAATVALRNASDHEARVRPVLERLRAQSSDADLARAAERALAGLDAGHDGK